MDELLRQVIGVYVTEVEEQAQSISAGLLQAEAEPRGTANYRAALEEVFRQAHNLKGSSAALGITDLEQLAHAVESALSAVRRGQQPLSHELVDAGLQAADAARQRIPGLSAESTQGQHEVEVATTRLLDLAHDAALSTLEPPVPPATPDAHAAPALAAEAPDSIRVAVQRLEKLEYDITELHVTSGRLGRYSQELAKCLQLTHELWQNVRQQVLPRTLDRPQPLHQLLRSLQSLRRELHDDSELLAALAGRQDDELRAMRLVSAALIQEPLQRAVREACRAAGREAQLTLLEEQVYLDRALLEELKNPLIHLVRNAVDHGIEPPEVRQETGKPPRGTITVRIEQRAELLLVSVQDDGRGIDLSRVREQAVSRGLVSGVQAADLDDAGLYRLLFMPGFSTAESITELSGRGVGLDVVQRAVARLHGQVSITSTLGQGTRLDMSIALTVAASSMLLIKEGDHTLALPQACVESIVLLPVSQLLRIGSRLLWRREEQTYAVALLGPLLGLKAACELPPRLPLLILRTPGPAVALLCSQILGAEELILRPLPPELRDHRWFSGVALSPSSAARLVLSPTFLMQEAYAEPAALDPEALGARSVRDEAQAPAPVRMSPTVLIADDSITTRTLLRSILESDGYTVRTAADGDEALQLLRSEPVALVVSDVRMPRLDGLGLLTKMRAEPRTAAIPVVLFSSLSSEEDQLRGESAGAAAYLSKSAFDRGQLFDVVARLLGRTS